MLKTIIGLAIAFMTLAPATILSASAEEIYLRSKQSGKFVAMSDGKLAARANATSGALKLDMVRLEGNRIAFRDIRSNSYIRAGIGQGAFLAPGSPHIRGWETFELTRLGNGVSALRSAQNGKLVRAGVGSGSLLAAVSQGKPRGWEMFTIVPARAVAPGNAAGSAGDAVSGAVAGSWRITSLATRQTGRLIQLSAALNAASRVDIQADGSLRATAGCNMITSDIRQSGASWQSTNPIMTRMACQGQGVMETERSFAKAVRDATRISMIGRTVTLKNGSGQTVLIMAKR